MKEVYQLTGSLIRSLGRYIVLQGTSSLLSFEISDERASLELLKFNKHYLMLHLHDGKRDLHSASLWNMSGPVHFPWVGEASQRS